MKSLIIILSIIMVSSFAHAGRMCGVSHNDDHQRSLAGKKKHSCAKCASQETCTCRHKKGMKGHHKKRMHMGKKGHHMCAKCAAKKGMHNKMNMPHRSSSKAMMDRHSML